MRAEAQCSTFRTTQLTAIAVWEWALDGWQENYPTSAQTNYAKLDAEKFRTMRGGCWDSTAKLAHGASRTGLTPTTNYAQVGVRCARNL